MQHVFLGFRLRMGRLAFFLSTCGTTVIALTFALGLFELISEFAAIGNRGTLRLGVIIVIAALVAIVHCNICGMRSRDIGWDPAVVIPLWVLLALIDYMAALLLPELAVQSRYAAGTWIGKIVSSLFWLALLLHPPKPGGFVDLIEEEDEAEKLRPGLPRHLRPVVVPPSRFDRAIPRTSFGRLTQ